MEFFDIIIANYNSEEWIEQCLNSILNQTFKDFKIIIVDDISSDKSVQKIREYNDKRIELHINDTKRWNGGSRNEGLRFAKGKYVLFMDCDDWLYDEEALENMYKVAVETKADCLRLPYVHYRGGHSTTIMLTDSNPKDLVNSCFVAPWTKCVKREKVVKFPENTLIEDVVQHIEQVDNIETVAICDKPIICWNRDNTESCSLPENLHKNNGKRISSVYRNIADLMDLECKHDYCEEHRKWREQCYKDIVRQGKEEEIW